jgi:polyribonucleotide nucleotidyltransferase
MLIFFIFTQNSLQKNVLQVNVPYEFHRSIIGQKGKEVREMMDRYDVHIVLSPADQKLDIIKVHSFTF